MLLPVLGRRTVLAVALLLSVCGRGFSAERPLDLNVEREFVYVPPGSAHHFLGLLFAQLEINGGVELGNLNVDETTRYLSAEEKEAKFEKDGSIAGRWVEVDGVRKFMLARGTDWAARPDDPIYFKEFLAKNVSLRDALDGYCRTNDRITWDLRDNVVNVRYTDLPKKNNALDLKIPSITFDQETPLEDCLKKIRDVARKDLDKLKVTFQVRMEEDRDVVLSDYANASERLRLSRGLEFKGKSIRSILNDLVRSFRNVVWVSTQSPDKNGRETCRVHFGSWRLIDTEQVRDPWYWLKILEQSNKHVEAIEKFRWAYPWASECMLWIYICYKEDPESAKRAVAESVERVRKGGPERLDGKPVVDGYILTKLEMMQKYLTKEFGEYARKVLWIIF